MPDNKRKLYFLPNLITSIGIFSGSLAVILAIEGERGLIYASYLVFFSAILDFLDGFVARLLKFESEFGKHLDSLSNVISFGLAPTAIMYELLKRSEKIKDHLINLETEQIILLFTSFLIVVLSVIRLARLSSTKSTKNIIFGLSTPANAIFVASIPIICTLLPQDFWLYNLLHHLDAENFMETAQYTSPFFFLLLGIQIFIFENTTVLLPMFLTVSMLMISGFPMFSIRFHTFKYKDNKLKYNFIFYSIFLLIIFHILAIPLIIISYIVLSFINTILKLMFNKRAAKVKGRLDKVFANEN